MDTKTFSTRTILSVTTGLLLTKSSSPQAWPRGTKTTRRFTRVARPAGPPGDNGIGDMYQLLGWMTSDSPFTHQLGRFAEECKPWLLRWFPELGLPDTAIALLRSMIEESPSPEAGVAGWMISIKDALGLKDEYEVPKIPAYNHLRINPVGELLQRVSGIPGV